MSCSSHSRVLKRERERGFGLVELGGWLWVPSHYRSRGQRCAKNLQLDQVLVKRSRIDMRESWRFIAPQQMRWAGLTLNRAMHCAARTADGVSLLPMSRGRLAASRLSAVPRFAGKRASIEIPKGRKIFRHCIQRWTPRGSGICVDRRVQFVFHPRFQHIFVHSYLGGSP